MRYQWPNKRVYSISIMFYTFKAQNRLTAVAVVTMLVFYRLKYFKLGS